MEGKVLSADEAKGLADLDCKEVMLSKIAGLEGRDVRGGVHVRLRADEVPPLLEASKGKVPDDSAPRPRPRLTKHQPPKEPPPSDRAAEAEPRRDRQRPRAGGRRTGRRQRPTQPPRRSRAAQTLHNLTPKERRKRWEDEHGRVAGQFKR